jgi:small membrane protein
VIIKWLLVPALVLAVYLSLRSRASLRGQARRKLFAGATVVAGVLAVIFPGATQWAADAVGVTRGTDLLLYVLALVLIYLVGSTGVRFREQEARLVRLARQVALAEAEARIGLGVAPGFRGPAQHGHPSGATAATVAADIVVPSGEAGHRVS